MNIVGHVAVAVALWLCTVIDEWSQCYFCSRNNQMSIIIYFSMLFLFIYILMCALVLRSEINSVFVSLPVVVFKALVWFN